MNIKRKKILIAVLSVLFISILGFLLYLNQLPILSFTTNSPKVEINEEFDPKSIIKTIRQGNENDIIIDTKQLDIHKLGNYTITYSLFDETFDIEVSVVDTIAPTFDGIDGHTVENLAINPETLVENIQDATNTNVAFKEEYQFDVEGVYECIVVVSDEANNTTEKSVKITVHKDITAPVIEGDNSITKVVGSSFDPMEKMKVSDDFDKNVELKVISNDVNMKKSGTYKVEYNATDFSGNQATFTKTVTVKEKVIENNNYTGKNIVYLTFDDGPSYNTGKILKILDQYNIKATFFVTGYSATYRKYIKEAYDAGHTIALHTYTHDYGDVYASQKAYFEDLKEISDVVESITGFKSPYIRFPGGSSNTISRNYCNGIMSSLTQEVKNKGYQYYDWNISSADASGNNVSVNRIIKSATSASKGECMILFHDAYGKDTTVEALPTIIEYYMNKGFTFKAIDHSTPGFHHGVNN